MHWKRERMSGGKVSRRSVVSRYKSNNFNCICDCFLYWKDVCRVQEDKWVSRSDSLLVDKLHFGSVHSKSVWLRQGWHWRQRWNSFAVNNRLKQETILSGLPKKTLLCRIKRVCSIRKRSLLVLRRTNRNSTEANQEEWPWCVKLYSAERIARAAGRV